MKKFLLIFGFVTIFSLLMFSGCKDPSDSNSTQNQEDGFQQDSNSEVKISKEFWGTWIRMDTGDEYIITDKCVTVNGNATSGIGEITLESENVLKYGSSDTAPRLFRKGGSNRTFFTKLAGFSSVNSRGIETGSQGISGREVGRKNTNNDSDTQTVVSDEDGNVTFTDAVPDDTQEITVKTENGEEITIEVTPKFDGEHIGTIPLVEDGYSFKTTYSISGDLNGYYYANNFDTYPLRISMKNIGDSVCPTALYKLSCSDSNFNFTGTKEGVFTSILPNDIRALEFTVSYGNLVDEYKDVTIDISITDSVTDRTWIDSVTLRFYRKPVYVSVNTFNPNKLTSAKLNGFVITPDGKSKYFSVKHNDVVNVLLPWSSSANPIKVVFSGATADYEMYYAFTTSSEKLTYIDIFDWNSFVNTSNGTEQFNIVTSYEKPDRNDTENTSSYIEDGVGVTKSFIQLGDIDYFTVNANDSYIVNASSPKITKQPSDIQLRVNRNVTLSVNASGTGSISYQWYSCNINGENAVSLSNANKNTYSFQTTEEGNKYFFCEITNTITDNGDGGIKSKSIKTNVVNVCVDNSIPNKISYELNGGTNSNQNPNSYYPGNKITLYSPSKYGYTFVGWYTTSNFSGSAISYIDSSVDEDIKLYAKWTPTEYTITYNLGGGTNSSSNPNSYNIESNITLKPATKTGRIFIGWYTDSAYKNEIKKLPGTSLGNITLYAKFQYPISITSVKDISTKGMTVYFTCLVDYSAKFCISSVGNTSVSTVSSGNYYWTFSELDLQEGGTYSVCWKDASDNIVSNEYEFTVPYPINITSVSNVSQSGFKIHYDSTYNGSAYLCLSPGDYRTLTYLFMDTGSLSKSFVPDDFERFTDGVFKRGQTYTIYYKSGNNAVSNKFSFTIP